MISNTFLKYGLIGIINTIFGYGIIFFFMYIDFSAELSNLIGYIFGFFISYYLNKKYNFNSIKSHREDLPKFLISMGIAYLVNLLVLIFCYRYIGINAYISQIIAGVVYTLTDYLLSRTWVFKGNK